jgi:predicted ATPase
MAVNLLERDRELAALGALLGEITACQGRIAVVSGEAGIGKTSLVERFLAQSQERRQPPIRLLWAACEALFTPRPLGPLYDIAQQTSSPLRALLDSEANRATLFATVLDDLIQTPTILVVEDIHWADEATLDLSNVSSILLANSKARHTGRSRRMPWREGLEQPDELTT